MSKRDHIECLRETSKWRSLALQQAAGALEEMNEAVHEARAAGVSAIEIAEAIGTSRQRVYEILREA